MEKTVCDVCGKIIENANLKNELTYNFDICSYACSNKLHKLVEIITKNVRNDFVKIDSMLYFLHNFIMNMDLNLLRYHTLFGSEMVDELKRYQEDFKNNRIRFNKDVA